MCAIMALAGHGPGKSRLKSIVTKKNGKWWVKLHDHRNLQNKALEVEVEIKIPTGIEIWDDNGSNHRLKWGKSREDRDKPVYKTYDAIYPDLIEQAIAIMYGLKEDTLRVEDTLRMLTGTPVTVEKTFSEKSIENHMRDGKIVIIAWDGHVYWIKEIDPTSKRITLFDPNNIWFREDAEKQLETLDNTNIPYTHPECHPVKTDGFERTGEFTIPFRFLLEGCDLPLNPKCRARLHENKDACKKAEPECTRWQATGKRFDMKFNKWVDERQALEKTDVWQTLASDDPRVKYPGDQKFARYEPANRIIVSGVLS